MTNVSILNQDSPGHQRLAYCEGNASERLGKKKQLDNGRRIGWPSFVRFIASLATFNYG